MNKTNTAVTRENSSHEVNFHKMGSKAILQFRCHHKL